MQANKQQHSPKLSSSSSKQESSSNNNKLNGTKSVAQLVMEMTHSQNFASSESTKSNSANSLESDKEVEEITNRASKVDINVTSLNNNDQNINNRPAEPETAQLIKNTASNTNFSNLALNTPGLISSGEPISNSRQQQQQILTPSKVNLEQQRKHTHQSSRESLEKSDGIEISTTIMLDTKVPHPACSEMINKLSNNNEQSTFQSNSRKEVSYYNDQSVNLSSIDIKQKPPQSQSSNTNNVAMQISNNTNIAAASTNKSSRTKPLPLKEQKLSIIVPKSNGLQSTAALSSSASSNNHNTNLFSPDYINDDLDENYDLANVESIPEEIQGRCDSLHHDVSTSPKAKSAPATPCNVTPTAFHQHNSNYKSQLNNPANTLPVDTRRNISATCRILPSSISIAHPGSSGTTNSSKIKNNNSNSNNQINSLNAVSDQYLDKLIKEGEESFRLEDFVGAIHNFSQCIELATRNRNFDYLKKNFNVYSQRAEAYFHRGKYNQAIEDSMAARELNPKWAQAHYILGEAQFCLNQHIDSLTAFSFGLAQVPTNKCLFEALVSRALNSTLKSEFEPNYNKLRERDLDKDPFVVVSTLGQELLAKHYHEHAAIVLESALKLGTDDKKFKASVLSTTSFVFCAIGDYKKASTYMQRELEIENELNHVAGQCRVLSNIGYTYFKMRKYDKSLEAHREQLKLAIQNKLHQQAAQAFNATGHVHVARNDYTSALTSHQWCLEMLKKLGENKFDQYKELLAMGHIHSLLADYKASEEKYKEAIQMLDDCPRMKEEEHQVGSIMVHFNLAYLALKKQSFLEAKQLYESVITIAKTMSNQQTKYLYEFRALNGLGHTCRVFRRFDEARNYFTKQLDVARQLNDRRSQSQALCNLGMTCQHFKDYNNAWKFFDENLRLVEDDTLLKAYAYSYLASMHFLWGEYNQAQENYEKSLNIFKELEYCSSERKTIELNMAAVSERLGHSEVSLVSNMVRNQRKVMVA